jgi:hypothetical protein
MAVGFEPWPLAGLAEGKDVAPCSGTRHLEDVGNSCWWMEESTAKVPRLLLVTQFIFFYL